MNTQSTQNAWWRRAGRLVFPACIALLFFIFVFAYYPFRQKIQFDGDEGLNLMRSMLVFSGHPLYIEVSSDQPPLFTQLLSLLFRVVGFEVTPARLVVLLFASLLVWACAQFLQRTRGKLAALLFLLLMVMAPRFLVLSVSVMIGLPSIALATVSMLFVVLWHQKRNDFWLVASGFVLALSVLTKLFTGFLAPIFMVGMTLAVYFEIREKAFSWKKLLRPALIWGLCFGGLTIVLGVLLIGPQNLWEIIYPHLAAPEKGTFQGDNYTINFQLESAMPLVMLGILGGIFVAYKRDWMMFYPLAWAGMAYIFLSFYKPVSYHHQLLITVPAAMLAAALVAEMLQVLTRIRQPAGLLRPQAVLGIVSILGFGWVLLQYAPTVQGQLMPSPQFSGFSLTATAGKIKVISDMEKYSKETNWIVTDMPMYAFIVKKPVPPILATFSRKRLITGSLSDQDILTAMRDYHPEQVLMARFVIPELEAYLQEHYTLVSSPEFFRLFVRKDLKATPQTQ